jgi:hypothetical protein
MVFTKDLMMFSFPHGQVHDLAVDGGLHPGAQLKRIQKRATGDRLIGVVDVKVCDIDGLPDGRTSGGDQFRCCLRRMRGVGGICAEELLLTESHSRNEAEKKRKYRAHVYCTQ